MASLVVKLVASSSIGLTAVGWLMVVIGFGIARDNSPCRQLCELSTSYLYWVVSIVGPFTFIAALVHLFVVKVKSVGRIAGAIAAFLSTFFLTGLGMILYIHRIGVHVATEAGAAQQILPWFNLAFAGSVLATLFWTIVIILWHFKDIGVEKERSAVTV